MDPVIDLDGLEVRFGARAILKQAEGFAHGPLHRSAGSQRRRQIAPCSTPCWAFTSRPRAPRAFSAAISAPHAREVRSLIGYMPENDAFIAGMTGVHFVRLMAELAGLPREHALERAHEAFFYVGLGEVRYRTLGTYSLGMKQSAKLAQAIAHGPKLLFLDEPTNGLDPPARTPHDPAHSGDSRPRRSPPDPLLAPAARRGGVLRRGADPQGRPHRRVLQPGRGAPLQPPLPGNRNPRRAQRQLPRRHRTLGCETAPGVQGRIKLVLPDGLEVRRLYEVAAAQNVQIRRLNHKRDSLEDIFLKAMETADGRL